MSKNDLPSFEDLGIHSEDLFSEDERDAEKFFNDYVDAHFDDIPENILKKITLDAGNIVDDDEPVDIEEFKSSLLLAFTINEYDIDDPGEYLNKVLNGEI